VLLVCAGLAHPTHAQVSSADRKCITSFNKGVRKVAKAQGQIIRKCLKDFASGSLAATTPENCIRTDPNNRLTKAVDKAIAIFNDKCSGPLPAFGVTPVTSALLRTSLAQIDLVHATLGADLDAALIPNAMAAGCQSRAIAKLVKCEDRRWREYLKCQKVGMRTGAIDSASSMAATCLGIGTQPQPDSGGRIAQDCVTKVSAEIGSSCSSTNLTTAFAPCNAVDAAGLTACLERQSACQLCRLINDVDGLSRDCDLFDDGDGNNGSCGAECGDGVLQEGEFCDDQNLDPLDGCSLACTVEGGWTCTGEPSVCTPNCGNGDLDAGELCDDGNTADDDGCSALCVVEDDYSCSGEPSVCTLNCSNGDVEPTEGEVCDDGNAANGDGCSNACLIEAGYNCSGEPSVCTFVCGNGSFQSGETCDDNDAVGGDGCSAVCQIETGWICSSVPSLCTPVCGDGLLRGGETCDDDDNSSGDGCSSTCQEETGYSCNSEPSNCLAVCGDNFIRGFETCDDGDTDSGDGCSGTFCRQELGYTCTGQPSVCVANCGDGNLDPQEECDDGGTIPGNGCGATCLIEAGYACGGEPSVCASTCGNGFLNANEDCDDGNLVSEDGCDDTCDNETGWVCFVPGLPCTKFELFIDSPAHGIFTTAGSVTVTGHYTTLLPTQVSITINGTPADSVNTALRTFSHTLFLDEADIFNPARVVLTNTDNGDDIHRRIVVIRGQSVADGSFSNQSVALRINDTGLDSIEPLVAGLAAGQFNLADILPPGTVLADECFITVIGCWGSAQVRIANPPPSFSHLTLAMDSLPGVVFGDIDIFNLRIDVDIDGSGLVPDCGLRLTANALQLTGNYSLEPMVGSPSNVDVNLVTPLGVQFSGFNHTFTYGLCNAPIIGDIIQSFLPDIEQFATDGINGFLADPDGSGPADSPIAAGIQTTLAGISISGAVGSGLGLMLDSPLFQVAEDHNGLTLGAHSKFTVSVGSGPGQCIPPPGAPDFSASYSKTDAFPPFGPNTPVGNDPYGIGIAISTAGFNQLLRGQTECGLMRSSLTTIDLDGPGGNPPLALTSSLLSLIVPELGQLPPGTPLRIDIAPSLAPIITGNPGPAGELTELKIAHVTLDIIEPGPETVWIGGALDARLGMNLAFDGSGLAISLTPPPPADLAVAILVNPLNANEAQVEAVLPAIVAPLIPSLAGALSGFPLPQFLGLNLAGVEVSRTGQFLSLYANLTPGP